MSRPHGAYKFRVEIDDVTGDFAEVSGLDVQVEPIEYRNGSDPTVSRKLPGLAKFSNIVLKRGVTGSRDLWDWMRTVRTGKTDRRSGSIILLDEEGKEVSRWNFYDGWPCKWVGPMFRANASEVAIETLEICHEGIDLA